MAPYGYDYAFRRGAGPVPVERGARDFGRGSYGGRIHARGAYDLDVGPARAPRYDFDLSRVGRTPFRRRFPERESWSEAEWDRDGFRAHGGASGRVRGTGGRRLRGVYGSDYRPGDPRRGRGGYRGGGGW